MLSPVRRLVSDAPHGRAAGSRCASSGRAAGSRCASSRRAPGRRRASSGRAAGRRRASSRRAPGRRRASSGRASDPLRIRAMPSGARRVVLVAALALAALASVCAAPASAANYGVNVCRHADGSVAPADGWQFAVADDFAVNDIAVDTCSLGGMLDLQLR